MDLVVTCFDGVLGDLKRQPGPQELAAKFSVSSGRTPSLVPAPWAHRRHLPHCGVIEETT